MRLPRLALAVCIALAASAAGAAHADPAWDHKYTRGTSSGAWPCPESGHDVEVSGGQFSIPWDVTIETGGQRTLLTIGRIAGTVNPDGTASARTEVLKPLPRAFVAEAQRREMPAGTLRNMRMTVRFGRNHLSVSGNGCSASWTPEPGGASTPTEPVAPTQPAELDCNGGEYAVALWAAERAYKPGGFARYGRARQPIHLYRCTGECVAGKPPGDGSVWALVGACAGQIAPDEPVAPPAPPTWNTTYTGHWNHGANWRCPGDGDLATVTVAHDKFSIPWTLHYDHHKSELPIGRIDGVIAADGTATLTPVFSVDKLPAALVALIPAAERAGAMASLRSAPLAMSFAADDDPKKHAPRRAYLAISEGCDLKLSAAE